MSYYDNSPALPFAWDGHLVIGWSVGHELSVENATTVERQLLTFTESQTTVLASDVIHLTQRGTHALVDTAGVTGPELPAAWTAVWVLRDGEWKVHGAHMSHRTPETP